MFVKGELAHIKQHGFIMYIRAYISITGFQRQRFEAEKIKWINRIKNEALQFCFARVLLRLPFPNFLKVEIQQHAKCACHTLFPDD
jgi:hypothetical protein